MSSSEEQRPLGSAVGNGEEVDVLRESEVVAKKKGIIENCKAPDRVKEDPDGHRIASRLHGANGIVNGIELQKARISDDADQVLVGPLPPAKEEPKDPSSSPSHCVVEGDKAEASASCSKDSSETDTSEPDADISYVSYRSELQMPDIMRLIQKDLSEPYSIYTYRYFIHNWPKLCFLAMDSNTCVGAIVCKLDIHRKVIKRGYIAMLAVDEKYRKRKIGTNLVLKAIRAMVADDADEIVLETEITNKPALRLYENLGFVRDKRLFRYYLNGVDALRLKLWLR